MTEQADGERSLDVGRLEDEVWDFDWKGSKRLKGYHHSSMFHCWTTAVNRIISPYPQIHILKPNPPV